jgi:hypothetical protein
MLVFVLAVAVACVLAGAKSFREIGDQAADLPQEILARLGGKPHPLLRRIIAPSEKRVRTLIHAIGAESAQVAQIGSFWPGPGCRSKGSTAGPGGVLPGQAHAQGYRAAASAAVDRDVIAIRRASRRPIPPSPGAGAAAGPGGQRPLS